MPETKHMNRSTLYASSADFQRIFDEDMNRLYLLSYLLTGDREKAEQCFVSGLDDAVGSNPVFKEWARSWARRVIIQNAVRLINPRAVGKDGRSRSVSVDTGDKLITAEPQAEIAAVLALEPFDRFVYVVTVLEEYSEQDCSVLLGCTRRDVSAARMRALLQIGRLMDSHGHLLRNISAEKPVSHEKYSVFKLLVTPRVVTPA
jgi:DNA-directed RNA polymerase specialized sigma24 family protein